MSILQAYEQAISLVLSVPEAWEEAANAGVASFASAQARLAAFAQSVPPLQVDGYLQGRALPHVAALGWLNGLVVLLNTRFLASLPPGKKKPAADLVAKLRPATADLLGEAKTAAAALEGQLGASSALPAQPGALTAVAQNFVNLASKKVSESVHQTSEHLAKSLAKWKVLLALK